MKNIMLSTWLCFFLVVLNEIANAQKPFVTLDSASVWSRIYGDKGLSNDGKYCFFCIESDSGSKKYSLIFKAVENSWEKEIISSNVLIPKFAQNGKIAAVLNSNDSLSLIRLGTPHVDFIPNVSSFIVPSADLNLVLYRLKRSEDVLVLLNLKTGKRNSYPNVKDYWVSPEGKLVLLLTTAKDGDESQVLYLVNQDNGTLFKIREGLRIGGLVFDDNFNQVAFTEQSEHACQPEEVSIWYYKIGQKHPKKLLDNESLELDTRLTSGSIMSFTNDGLKLYINLQKKASDTKKRVNSAKVDVWSYTDAKPYEGQLEEIKQNNNREYVALIEISDLRLVRLEYPNNRIILHNNFNRDYELSVDFPKGDTFDWNWNKTSSYNISLISTKTGKSRFVDFNIDKPFKLNGLSYSPTGRYLVTYNAKDMNYYCYNTFDGSSKNITKGLIANWTSLDQNDLPESSHYAIGTAGWLKNDEGILIYDQNDIWKIDPAGNYRPINLTNGYGLKNHIVFRIAINSPNEVIVGNKRLLVTAFNLNNKNNGFFSVNLVERSNPTLLHMSNDVYSFEEKSLGRQPIKAKNNNVYLLTRENSSESSNYFSTIDFKSYRQLSNVYPERAYNWLTSQLVTWQDFNGVSVQGILYKPRNFDPKKKYPLIFYYYEKLSDELNKFREAQPSVGPMNIPYFVSNEYLVFTPDIHFKIGETGNSALNSVVSAAKFLSKMPWIDSNKLGLQGHSFGGYETNYIVTHSKIFAAGCSASGMTDLISDYNSISHGGRVRQYFYENSQTRIGATLWQRPDLYIDNSPIFSADRVNTPLLMMQNKNDNAVPFTQGVELFNALRRLGKRVWMLQYDEGTHIVDSKSAVDYTIRMKQFFDHYLKGAQAPLWMLEGISAKDKGIKTGLELDSLNRTPGESPLMYKQKQ